VRALISAAVAGTLVLAPASLAAAADTATTAKVIRVVDGDTVVTTKGTVRVIGIDTPERGKCGHQAATSKAIRLAPRGATVRLTHPGGGTDNKDRYGRILRYVSYKGTDLGGAQIKAGFAKARYDSRDGYAWHPNQASYVRWDRAAKDVCNGSAWAGTSVTSGAGSIGASTVTQGAWNRPGPDLDCGDIPAKFKPVRITGTDYHRLDRDGDGWGCD
jgi:endonuclease YncB( thermonuclease family)